MSELDDFMQTVFGGNAPSDFDLQGLANSLSENDMQPTPSDNPYQLNFTPANNQQGHIYQLFWAYVVGIAAERGQGMVSSFEAMDLIPEFSHILENSGVPRETVLNFASRMIGGLLMDNAKDMLPEMVDELSELLDGAFRQHS